MLALLPCGALIGALSGCRPTDAFKQIVYQQDAQDIDYANPSKFLISDSSSKEKSELVSASEVDEDAAETEEVQNLVIYGTQGNTDKAKAKRSAFSKTPDFKNIQASEGVTLYYSTGKDAIDHEVEHQDKEQPEKKADAIAHGSGTSDSTDEESESGGSTGKGGKGAKSGGREKTAKESDDGAGARGDEVEVVDATGAFTDPPKLESVAATGSIAVMVQMVGGKGALAAADEATIEGELGVFPSADTKKVVQGWKGGGSAEAIDAKAIVSSGADAILVTSSEYQDGFSKSARKALSKAGIACVTVYDPVNSTHVKSDVEVIAEMLAESTKASNSTGAGGTGTLEVSDAYKEYHDDVVNACIEANGGKLASANDTVYEGKNKKRYSFDSGSRYTLLVDGFDESAVYSKTVSGWRPSCNGVALTTLGWSHSPVSFYIQAGGLINNAAALSADGNSKRIFAFQFNTNGLPMQKGNWDFSASGEAARTENVSVSDGNGWKRTVFNTGLDPAGNGAARSFGSKRFPKMIATSARARSKIVANSKDDDGLYHPYKMVSADSNGVSVNFIGKLTSGGGTIYSSIGVDAEGTATDWSGKQIPEDAIEVNPVGLGGSWTAGTVEAFLEAAWVNDVVADNEEKVGLRGYVEDFYKKFYKHALSGSEYKSILDGGD